MSQSMRRDGSPALAFPSTAIVSDSTVIHTQNSIITYTYVHVRPLPLLFVLDSTLPPAELLSSSVGRELD